MKYVIGAGAVLAAIGTAAYLYLQYQDVEATTEEAGPTTEEAPETNI